MDKNFLNVHDDLVGMIVKLTNAWVALRMPEHNYDQRKVPDEIDALLDIPLRMIYALVHEGLMERIPKDDMRYIGAEKIIKLLDMYGVTAAAASSVATRSLRTVEIITEKTNLSVWLQQQEANNSISGGLRNVLIRHMENVRYLEDIDEYQFSSVRHAGPGKWQEFVRLRGW